MKCINLGLTLSKRSGTDGAFIDHWNRNGVSWFKKNRCLSILMGDYYTEWWQASTKLLDF